MATVKQHTGNEEGAALATLPPDYHPSPKEDYMCPKHLEYFRLKLEDWKAELLHESIETIHHMQEETHNEPDLADRATTETDRAFELRTRDRERKLINKINDALMRIRDGSYGYCEDTDEPIGLARLEARPIATLCLEAQERHERNEKVHSD
ncbi:MAG TPA: RNA polymerase-binding protein DksA [Holosporales bacterium]|nr:RNA polymerase-binding protein DksA [Holosporales bacterium]